MTQILIIHGGESFSNYEDYLRTLKSREIDYEQLKPQRKWKTWIAEQLQSSDVLLPTFPNGYNAAYDEWVIYFEKIKQFFADDVQIIGHSLGAMFLAKYLHSTPLERPVSKLILIAGLHSNDTIGDCGSFVVEDASGLDKSALEVHLFHSEDDPVVPFSELLKYQADLPTAISHIFKDRGHFNDETFPELLDLLKQK